MSNRNRGRRTNMIKFSRCLRPQPPYNSSPYWWGIGDLSFYDKNHKQVWHQEIPEASLYFNSNTFFGWLTTPRFYHSSCSVRRDKLWGWILEFEMSHEEAAKIWAVLFKDHPEIESRYNREDGQFFVYRPMPMIVSTEQSPETQTGIFYPSEQSPKKVPQTSTRDNSVLNCSNQGERP